MPVPHLEIRIVQRSKGSSAVAGAAYQAGEKLFSEYDQKMKNYLYKKEVVYTEVKVYVMGFGWVEYEGPNRCEDGTDIYENGNKIGVMG